MADYARHLLKIFPQMEGHHDVQKEILRGLSTVMELDPQLILESEVTFLPLLEVVYSALRLKDQKVALAAAELFSGLVPLCFDQQLISDDLCIKLKEKLPLFFSSFVDCCHFAPED